MVNPSVHTHTYAYVRVSQSVIRIVAYLAVARSDGRADGRPQTIAESRPTDSRKLKMPACLSDCRLTS